MFNNTLLNYPIDLILIHLGCKKGAAKNMWFSPFRAERTASFHYDEQKNVWFDHGAGIGGTNVQLIMLVKHCSYNEAKEFIASLAPSLKQNYHEEQSTRKKNEITQIRPLCSNYLKKYVESRKIPYELAKLYCKEITIHNYERKQNFTWLGFENNAGGYAMSSQNGFKSTNKAGITTISTEGKRTSTPSSDNVMVFEGFFDFLSWLVMQNIQFPNCDAVILNSAHLLHKAIVYIGLHKSVICFFDNDETGKKYLQETKDHFKGKNIKDLSILYKQHNDLNDMLKASRGYIVEDKPKQHIKK